MKDAHPILEDFGLILDNNRVVVSWTIKAGNSCNGITIYRSNDDFNWSQIGRIDGVCGDMSESMSYIHVDNDPAWGQKSYYRLELGFEGFSASISIFLFDPKDKLILNGSNPVRDFIIATINDDGSPHYRVALYHADGRLIYILNNIYQNINIDVFQLASGLYFLSLYNNRNELLQTRKIYVIN